MVLYSDFFYCIIPSCTLLLSILRLLYTLFSPVGLRLLSSYLFLHVRLLDTSLLELNLMYFTLVQVTLFDCLLYTLFHSFPLYITGGPFTMVWLTFYSYSTLLYSTFFHFFFLCSTIFSPGDLRLSATSLLPVGLTLFIVLYSRVYFTLRYVPLLYSTLLCATLLFST